MKRIEDVMSEKVETISPNESADHAWHRMVTGKIHHLVVMEDHDIVGILSSRDLGGKNGAVFRRNHQVADLMTPNPVVAHPAMSLKDAINELRGFTVGCIPVVESGKLVGIVTLTDLLEKISRGLERGAVKTERRSEIGVPIYRRPGHPPIT